jgi:putative acetyltransferase
VFADNAPAIALYEALGFAHEGRRRSFVRFGDRYVDDLVMAKLL